MNRRKFVSSSGAAAVALGAGLSPQKSSAAVGSKPAQMKLGCQSAPTNETHLKYFARYGVRNICGYPEIADGRLYATVDELKRMRDLAEKNGITHRLPGAAFLASSHIDKEKHPAIMLAQSPERDRDIESMQTMIRNCAHGGHPVDQIQHEHPGRAAHRPHSGPRRCHVQHLESEGSASGAAADARRTSERGRCSGSASRTSWTT